MSAAGSSRALCVALGAGLCLACSADLGQPDTRSSALIYGEPSPAGEEDSVLLLRNTAAGETLCTATLIAPNLALTARHCVAFASASGFQCTPEGELIPNPEGRGTLGSHVPPETLQFHAGPWPSAEPIAFGKHVISTLGNTMCRDDLGLVVLDRALDLPVQPVRLERATEVGEELTVLGFGLTEQRVLEWQQRPRHRLSGQPILTVGAETRSEVASEVPPRTFLLAGPGACVGDSGGPAISERTGAVVGVFSLLRGEKCEQFGALLLYTHVPPFRALVREAFMAAGAQPLPEPCLEGDTAPECQPARERRDEADGCSLARAPNAASRGRGQGALALITALFVGGLRRVSGGPRAGRSRAGLALQ